MSKYRIYWRKFIPYFMGITFAAVLIFLDQLTKHLAASHLEPDIAHNFINGFLNFMYNENSYALFGFLPFGTWFFIMLAILIPGPFIFLYIKPLVKGMRVFLVLCFSGAAGNIANILQHGYVVNFLQFEFFNIPIINLADVYIVCGALALIIITFMPDKAGAKDSIKLE